MGKDPHHPDSPMALIERKVAWVLTAQGWGVLLLVLIIVSTVFVARIHPFLAVNAPIQAEVLVVEGWLPDSALKEALQEFQRGSYRQLLAVGGPIARGFYLSDYKTFADLAVATLTALGGEPEKLIAVPIPPASRGRTNALSMGLKHWLETSGSNIHRINLYSEGAHARRSWLSFQRSMRPTVKVGILAARPGGYNPDAWWDSSEGLRVVVCEMMAYFYDRIVSGFKG